MEEIQNGCLWLGEKTTDYILTEWLLDVLPALYMQDEKIFQYNQWAQSRSKKSCTLFSPIWAVSSLFNVEIPLSVIKDRDSESYKHGRRKDEGRLIQLWVDFIVDDCWNKSEFWKKYGNVAYYSIALKDFDLMKKVHSKRYSICTWYQWNSKYNSDKNDGVLDLTDRWSWTYWHAVQTIRSINENPARILDNYFWSAKYNIYDVKHKFSEIPSFYERWYVLTKVKEDNLERVKELNIFRTNALLTIETLWKMRHQTTVQSFRNDLHDMAEKLREKVKDIDEQLKLLS